MKNFVADTEDIAVAEIYKDSDYSGTNFDRPGFTQMMEDIKHGKINCVIVKDLSRLGRNYVETSNYIERLSVGTMCSLAKIERTSWLAM